MKFRIFKILFFLFSFSFIIGQNAPLADPGEDRIVNLGDAVTLDGSGSFDPDGDNISDYIWTGPDDIILIDDPENPAIKTFTAPDYVDTLSFSLSVIDANGDQYEPYPSNDIFISEYCEGSSPNQYIELYNGTNSEVDLSGYELWILKGDSNMSWDEPDWILLFNTNSTNSDVDFDLGEDGDEMQRVDVEPLMPGQTLMIIREGEDEDFEYSGRNYIVWDRMLKLGGDEPIALINKNGIIIDQVGDDQDPGSGFEVAGFSAATRNHTLVRKGTVVDGNTDWTSSAGTNIDDSEWIVYEEDYFSSVFTHDCRSCDGEVNIYVLAAPISNAGYLLDNLELNQAASDLSTAYEVCSPSITLDASSSISFTGEIFYSWVEGQPGNGEYDLGEEWIDYPDGEYNGEEFIDIGDGEYNDGEPFVDALNGVYDEAHCYNFEDLDQDDCENGGHVWIQAEEFTDIMNGVYDEAYCYNFEDLDQDECENDDHVWIQAEEFIDAMNGVWNEGEVWTDALNGVYDAPEDFIDMNDNNEFDSEYCHSLVGYTLIEFDGVDESSCQEYGYIWGPEPFTDANDNGIWDSGEEFTDIPNGEYDEGEEFVDAVNGIWNEGEEFVDALNSVWDEGEEFTDIGNGIWDDAEDFTDANDNGIWDDAEDFTDVNDNGQWDLANCENENFLNEESCEDAGHNWIEEEPYEDLNGNGKYDEQEDFTDNNDNGLWDDDEDFIDINENSIRDYYCMDIQGNWSSSFSNSYSCENVGYVWTGEAFIDIGNGEYDDGELFIDALNGVYDEAHCYNFEDLDQDGCENGDHVWIQAEEFTDVMNGVWNTGEDFTDIPNGKYDIGEEFVDAFNGIYDEGEEFVDAFNGVYDEGEMFTDALNGVYDVPEDFIDSNFNGILDFNEDFTDLNKNGIWDEGEDFIDALNGVWDEVEEFTDIGNGVWNEGEWFDDAGNEEWDEGEPWTDLPISNRILCQANNHEWTVTDQLSFCDENNSEEWDEGELANLLPNIIIELDEDECLAYGGVYDESIVMPQYDDDMCILDSDQLSRRRPDIDTVTKSFCDEDEDEILDDSEVLDMIACNGADKEWISGKVLHGDFSFILTVSDGLLESSPDILNINIAENLCSHPSANVVGVEYISFCDQNSNGLYDSDYGESGEIKNEELCTEDEDVWYLNIPHLIDKNNGVLIYDNETFNDIGNGIWEQGEEFEDSGNQFYDGPEPFEDANGNCVWDAREPHQNDYSSDAEAISTCSTLNGEWTYLGSTLGGNLWNQSQNNSLIEFNSFYFCDLNDDGVWESGEKFYDCNETRTICEYNDNWEEGLGNGVYDYNLENQEDFIDVDGNCYWSAGEPYLDSGNGVYDEGESFTDIGNGVWDAGETFIDINNNGVYDSNQTVLISGLNSIDFDPGSQVISYEWNEITGHLSDNDIQVVDSLSSNGGIISFIRPSFENAEEFVDQNGNGTWDVLEPFTDLNGNSLWDGEYGDVTFTLRVTDGLSSSQLIDTLTIKFRSPSAPDIPNLYARVEGDYVEGEETVGIVLTWEVNAENSVDDLTGYYDFEGYRLYKSTDGGETWGTENDKIYINGEFKGWKPFRQWDYTREEDLAHCIYSNDACSENNRNIDVVGYDPYSYWIDVGENSGITHYYFDDDIINGIEYTYALTAYDTGVWTTYESEITNTIEWYDSNPNNYTNVNGEGFPSMESALIDLDQGRNVSSVIPGYYASDIDFPTFAESNEIIVADSDNNGNGLASYQITNLEELEDVKIHFEIEADPRTGANINSFEGLHTANPALYAFYLGSDGMAAEVVSYPYTGLLNVEIDSLLDLPGAYSENDMIYHPIYEIENHEIKYLDDDDGTFTSFDYYTEFISGTRMRFLNPLREYGWTKEKFVDFSDLENLIFFDLTSSSDHLVPIIGSGFNPNEQNNDLSSRIGYSLKFNYDNSTTTFDNRPPYTYRIELSKNAQYMVKEVQQDGVGGCAESANNTLLPFRVYNLTTEKYVGLRHVDRGWHNGGLMGQVPYLAPAQGCEDNPSLSEPGNYTGDCDCIWAFYEDVVFVADTVTTSSNITPHEQTTYSFELNGNFTYLQGVSAWTTNSYDEGQKVHYGGMKWESRTEQFTDCNSDDILDGNGDIIHIAGSVCEGDSDWNSSYGNEICDSDEDYIDDNYNGKWDSGNNTDPLCPPGPMFCDTNGDGIDDGGSWKPIYPWQDLNPGNESLYIDIEPWTWFADGDKWIADIGKLGAKKAIDNDVLDDVTVSPNPYRGSSGYPKNGIYFNHLPTECEINIFTVSGERVFRYKFDSADGPNEGAEFYGSYEWDLRNQKGETVGPGLYIYTVESLDYENKYIGKFAIVR